MISRSVKLFCLTLIFIFISLFVPFFISSLLQVEVIHFWAGFTSLLIVLVVFQVSFWLTFLILRKLKFKLILRFILSIFVACLLWGIFAYIYYPPLNTKAYKACSTLSGPIVGKEKRNYSFPGEAVEIHNYGQIEDFIKLNGKATHFYEQEGFQTYTFNTKRYNSCSLNVNKSNGIIENSQVSIE